MKEQRDSADSLNINKIADIKPNLTNENFIRLMQENNIKDIIILIQIAVDDKTWTQNLKRSLALIRYKLEFLGSEGLLNIYQYAIYYKSVVLHNLLVDNALIPKSFYSNGKPWGSHPFVLAILLGDRYFVRNFLEKNKNNFTFSEIDKFLSESKEYIQYKNDKQLNKQLFDSFGVISGFLPGIHYGTLRYAQACERKYANYYQFFKLRNEIPVLNTDITKKIVATGIEEVQKDHIRDYSYII